MLFNTLGFVVFLTVVLSLYYIPQIPWKGKKGMLLLASYLFYALWNPPLVTLLWLSTIVDWTAGKRIYQEEDPVKRKGWVFLSVLVNLGVLGFFKYGGFVLENFTILAHAVGWNYEPAALDILLPMGISFYTFQTMSYTIDMYYRKTTPAESFLDFALYVTFFPQLVAGPIVRSDKLIPQFYKPKRATVRQFTWGLGLLTLGLFQKVVLADAIMAGPSDQVFGEQAAVAALDAWTGVLAFSGQIFFDFAGYSTCAIGIALTLGIVLPDNFRYPYAATGFSDLWKRWHISLSSWLRDYLYIPLGGNRKGPSRTYVNLMLTMLLGGLWHGAAWTFVVWGALHGIFLMVERLVKSRVSSNYDWWNGISYALITYFCVNITWVFFRADTFEKALSMLASMFFMNGEGKALLPTFQIFKVLALTFILFVTHWLMRDTSVKEVAAKTPWWALGLIWAGMLFLIIIAQGTGDQFIYFQF